MLQALKSTCATLVNSPWSISVPDVVIMIEPSSSWMLTRAAMRMPFWSRLHSAENRSRKLMIPVGRVVKSTNGGYNYAPTRTFDRVELRGSLIAQENRKNSKFSRKTHIIRVCCSRRDYVAQMSKTDLVRKVRTNTARVLKFLYANVGC